MFDYVFSPLHQAHTVSQMFEESDEDIFLFNVSCDFTDNAMLYSSMYEVDEVH